jgi:Rrf2 family iron-sulfur cluster assembly transcriptional regulator
MRLELHKKTELALLAMQELCLRSIRVSGPDLADAIGTTRQYLPQVLMPLVRAQWVASTPGPHGGYQILVDLEDVSMLDLVEAMEGPTDNAVCVLTAETCPRDQLCAMHGAWKQAKAALLNELSSMSVADAWAATCG